MKRFIIAFVLVAMVIFVVLYLLATTPVNIACKSNIISPTIKVRIYKGIKRMNSTELSKYLGFTPTIPKGWKAVCGDLYDGIIYLKCVNGSKSYKIVRHGRSLDVNCSTLNLTEYLGKNEINAENKNIKHVKIDNVRVWMEGFQRLIFSKGGVTYEIYWPYSNGSLEVVKMLIEHPKAFDYRIPVSVMRVYEFNRTKNIKSFVEERFKHKVILPYPYDVVLINTKNDSYKIQVRADLDQIDIANDSVTLEYYLSVSIKNATHASSVTYPIDVNESLKGKIPSDAKKVMLESTTVWVKSGKYYTNVYAKRDDLLINISADYRFPTNVPKILLSKKYPLDFAKYFLQV